MIASATESSLRQSLATTPRMADADHPRFLEVVVGRMLELMVLSVEGIRDRVRGSISVH